MIESMAELVRAQLDNQMATAGIVAVAFGALLAALRKLPGQLWALLQRRFVTSVDVADHDQAFFWVQRWLANHEYSKRARSLTATTKLGQTYSGPSAVRPAGESAAAVEVVFTPAPGAHLLWWRGQPVLLHRNRREVDSGTGELAYHETISLRAFSRDLIRALILDARECAVPSFGNMVGVFRANGWSWKLMQRRAPRSMESVVLADGVAEEVVADVRRFIGSVDWYRSTNIPYQRGYLLHGPPGNGKTSLVVAIASLLRRDVYVCNLAATSDDAFTALMNEVPENGILLLEDVDRAFHKREKTDDSSRYLSFAGFINAIDGVAAPEGRVLFMTTNHPEALDPALCRPGRCDRKFEIGHATEEQALRLFQRFFPGYRAMAVEFADGLRRAGRPVSMAELQEHLIANRDDALQAAEFARAEKATNGIGAVA